MRSRPTWPRTANRWPRSETLPTTAAVRHEIAADKLPQMLNLAVVGHVEWVTHTDAPFIPAAGEIVHLSDPLTQPAGGGAVTAAALVRAGARVSFYTAAADDVPVVEALEGLGVRVLAAPHPAPHTRCLVMRDADGERTICVIGENLHPTADDPLPWGELDGCDGVYFTGGDPRTLRLARRARVLVVTARRFDVLAESGVRADVLVGSARDRGERFDLGRLAAPPDQLSSLTAFAAAPATWRRRRRPRRWTATAPGTRSRPACCTAWRRVWPSRRRSSWAPVWPPRRSPGAAHIPRRAAARVGSLRARRDARSQSSRWPRFSAVRP